jgi:hypothetical protein
MQGLPETFVGAAEAAADVAGAVIRPFFRIGIRRPRTASRFALAPTATATEAVNDRGARRKNP